MADPQQPHIELQGKVSCVIGGRELKWTNCTCSAGSMGLDQATFGAKIVSGCRIRDLTDDVSGGTTIPQVTGVLLRHYDVNFEERIGGDVCSPTYAAGQLRRYARGFILQGNTHPLLSTRFRSTKGSINHAVWICMVRGGTTYEPAEALVYDPAADGRYSWVDSSPSWWPWWLVKQFAAALRPWGDDDPRTLGGGKFYAAFMPHPNVTLRYGAHKTTPYPDRTRIGNLPSGRLANVRTRPDRLNSGDIVARWPEGKLFVPYQVTHGASAGGSTVWYGNGPGNRWIHKSNLTHIRGAS